jgi:hypothetical protein
MIAVRLVRLIEQHSEELTDGLLKKFQNSPRTGDLHPPSAAFAFESDDAAFANQERDTAQNAEAAVKETPC